MTDNDMLKIMQGTSRKTGAVPSFDHVLVHRRRRRLRPPVIAIMLAAAGAALTFMLLPSKHDPASLHIALPVTTDWLSEPTGTEWLRTIPKIGTFKGGFDYAT